MSCQTIPAGGSLRTRSSRRVFFAAVIAVCICTIHSLTFAQSEIKIAGLVLDSSNGSPVPGAAVSLEGAGRYAITDGTGRFSFTDVPPGDYAVRASRIGYAASGRIAVSPGEAAVEEIYIRLAPSPVPVEAQYVTGSAGEQFKIERDAATIAIEIPEGGVSSISDIIDRIPELELVRSGPRQYIRIRGADLNATVVMLDGRVVNSNLDSRGDITSIPMGSISRIEIVSSGGSVTGGLAGSINFITGSRRGKGIPGLRAEKGSFGREVYALKAGFESAGGFDFSLDGHHDFYRGDFDFTDPRDSIQTRGNNQSRSERAFGSAAYTWGNGHVKVNSMYFIRNAGVPGPIFQLTPDALSRSREYEIYSTFENKPGDNLGISCVTGVTTRKADFDSPSSPTNFIPYKTRFDEISRDVRLEVSRTGKFGGEAYLSARYESLDGRDLIRPQSSFGHHSRLIHCFRIGAGYRISGRASREDLAVISIGFVNEWGSFGYFPGPSISIRTNPPLPVDLGFDISYSEGRRLPDLADLYWKEDVFATPNPDLEPERSRNLQAGADLKCDSKGTLDLRISRYLDLYRDLIIWRKWAGDKFKPLNLSRAEISGWEISLQSNPFSGLLSISWAASYSRPLNKEKEPNHHNKYLTFRPVGKQTLNLSVDFDPLKMKITGRHIGRRYTTEENTKSLSAVDLVDLDITYELRFAGISAKFGAGVTNLGDIQYEILDRQPERPREYMAILEISSKGGTR